jgi:hypothetical protein
MAATWHNAPEGAIVSSDEPSRVATNATMTVDGPSP